MECEFANRSALTITPATSEDAAQLVMLLREAAEWIRSKGINQWRPSQFGLEQTADKIGRRLVYKAVCGGTIVGAFELHETDPALWGVRPADALYLHRFVVKREAAGSGFGLLLLRWAEAEAASRGKRWLRLDCMAANERLNAYYREAGYRYAGRKDGDGWAASLYEKEAGGDLP
ncbi:MAG: protein tyrosine phosphatase [Paenibacillus sp.]|nr:protein tyrosine phosphatase [Paenibacillus sp.]